MWLCCVVITSRRLEAYVGLTFNLAQENFLPHWPHKMWLSTKLCILNFVIHWAGSCVRLTLATKQPTTVPWDKRAKPTWKTCGMWHKADWSLRVRIEQTCWPRMTMNAFCLERQQNWQMLNGLSTIKGHKRWSKEFLLNSCTKLLLLLILVIFRTFFPTFLPFFPAI